MKDLTKESTYDEQKTDWTLTMYDWAVFMFALVQTSNVL